VAQSYNLSLHRRASN